MSRSFIGRHVPSGSPEDSSLPPPPRGNSDSRTRVNAAIRIVLLYRGLSRELLWLEEEEGGWGGWGGGGKDESYYGAQGANTL